MRAREASGSNGCGSGCRRTLRHILLLLLAMGVRLQCSLAQASLKILQPSAVAYDASGNLFIVDTARNQVLESTIGGALLLVAGSGAQGVAGDGGPATAAQLNAPRSVAVGADGTLFIADTGNSRIRAISNGTIGTFAGNGQRGFSGDGGPAAAASLSLPIALAVDGSGALLICDTGNQRLRRVKNSVITTVAGTGVEGYTGDGGLATAAELDTPAGVAVAPDGRILIADAHNNRVRVILPSGVIETFAGSGARGFDGEGGQAVNAKLALPQGLSVDGKGQLLLADADNFRFRTVGTDGTITTSAGTRVQGRPVDGDLASSSSFNMPTATAVSPLGWPTLVDPLAGTVELITGSGTLYPPAGLAPGRVSAVALATPAAAVYGRTSASVVVTGSVTTPIGQVRIADGGVQAQVQTLAAGVAAFALPTLAAGSHTLTASYDGDGLNPSTSSGSSTVTIAPAPLVATAAAAGMQYGQTVPALAGTVAGELPQDAGSVTVSFSTSAGSASPVGDYPITASLSGQSSGNYALAMSSSSGSLHIAPAATTVTVGAGAQASYAGVPLLLTATVASATPASPTGSLVFKEGGVIIAQAVVRSGVASGFYLSPSAGTHRISAAFAADSNFDSSTSTIVSITVNPMPDFSLQTIGGAATVRAGDVASFSVNTLAQPAPFTGDVVLSVAGLPSGAVASFSPSQLIPGAGNATSTLTVQTRATAVAGIVAGGRGRLLPLALLALSLTLLRRKRTALRERLAALLLSVVALSCCGCGSRSVSESGPSTSSYTLTITGTSTNLAGAVVTHSATVLLNIQ